MKNMVKKWILMFLFLLILSIGYVADLDYQWSRFLRARDHTHQLEENLTQTHQRILQTNQYKILLSKTRAEFDQVRITLPTVVNLQAFINTTFQSGESQGLKFLTVNQQAVNTKDFYHIMPIQLVVLGTYQQFSNFLNFINTQHYFVMINDFAMTRQQPAETTVLKDNNNTPDMLMINATADFYYYP